MTISGHHRLYSVFGTLYIISEVLSQPGVPPCDDPLPDWVIRILEDNFCLDNSGGWHVRFNEREVCDMIIDPPDEEISPPGTVTVEKCLKRPASAVHGEAKCRKKELPLTSAGRQACTVGKKIVGRDHRGAELCSLDKEKTAFEKILKEHMSFPGCVDEDPTEIPDLAATTTTVIETCNDELRKAIQHGSAENFCLEDETVKLISSVTAQLCVLPKDVSPDLKKGLPACQVKPNLRVNTRDPRRVFAECSDVDTYTQASDRATCISRNFHFIYGGTNGGVCIVRKSFHAFDHSPPCPHATLQLMEKIIEISISAENLPLDRLPVCSRLLQNSGVGHGYDTCFLLQGLYIWHRTEMNKLPCKRDMSRRIRKKWGYCPKEFVNRVKIFLRSGQPQTSMEDFRREANIRLQLTVANGARQVQPQVLRQPLINWAMSSYDTNMTVESIVVALFNASKNSQTKRHVSFSNSHSIWSSNDDNKPFSDGTGMMLHERQNNKPPKRDERSFARRKLLQTSARISASITLSVRSIDVQDRDFPADLQQSLKRNVGRFDGGPFQIDSNSIIAVEVFRERKQGTRVNADTRRGSKWILIIVLVLCTASFMLLVLALITWRHTSKNLPSHVNVIRTQKKL